MVKYHIISLFILLTLTTTIDSNAQSLVPLRQGDGCLFNGKVYQNFSHYDGFTPVFKGVEGACFPQEYSLPSPPAWNNQTEQGNGSCIVWKDCISNKNSALKKGKLNEVNVPLDKYSLILLLIFGVLGYAHIRSDGHKTSII